MTASLKNYFYQLILLLGASIFLSFIVVIYCSLFEVGVHFYLQYYHSPFFYIGILFIAASSWLCTNYSVGARGSGHDLGKKHFDDFNNATSINDKSIAALIDTYFSSKVIIVKIISSIFASCGGAALGKEGPLVHMSMAGLAFCRKKLHGLNIAPSSILILGTCVGFAAAFKEPLIGLIYIFEIFGFKKARKYFIQNLIILCSTTYLSKFILDNLLHTEEFSFHLPVNVAEELLTFIHNIDSLNFSIILLFAALAGGASGALMQITRHYGNLYFKDSSTKTHIILPLITAIFIILLAHFGSARILGDGGYLLTDILYNPDGSTFFDFIGKYLNCVLALAVGCAGGVVIPAISLGAIFGEMISSLLSTPSALMILLCTASFLSSVIKAPLTTASLIIIFTKMDFNISIYVIITAYLSYYLSLLIKKMLGCKIS